MNAEEVADKVLPDVLFESLPKGWIVSLRHDVAKALNAFAEESCYGRINLARVAGKLEGRASALEEAAEYLERVFDHPTMAAEIRALSGK